MKTYFARHSGNLDISDSTLRRLKDAGKIAIHYPWTKAWQEGDLDTESLNPDDYEPAGKSAIRTLRELAKSGGYVCATYRHTGTAVVGLVQPGSEIELLRERWRSDDTRIAVLKALQLTNVIEVPASKQALLLSMAPQQSTLSQWHRVGNKVECLVENVPWAMEIGSLHSAYQEVMCSEFLRSHAREDLPRLRHLLLPVGRTMKGIDILGVADDGKLLLAQVTFGRSPSKRELLASFGEGGANHLIYFCDAEQVHSVGPVLVVPMQLAFREFEQSASGRQWFEAVRRLL